jgi:hypothetical protein
MTVQQSTGKPKIDWQAVRSNLDELGFARLQGVLAKEICKEIASYFPDERRFRSRIDMARYSFGRGEYKYFNYPLPPIVQPLRNDIYPELAPLANDWAEKLGTSRSRYPENLPAFLEYCHRTGQNRPTPLLLKYGPGDFNCLHQDRYGEVFFPFQVTFFLSQYGKDFTGGEFVLAEQRPRRQPRVEVITPDQGDAVIFAVHHRPVSGSRGYYRANFRHGVSTLQSGERYTLGVIFHDAQ